ncbi:MAG TPA: glycosyltransferase family 87 protein [Candidatus Dormibacteraeota bacterium]|jgi:hypothetical protein|nr:glycosyltransferase family 87 protein [Candidatus Dormibacteraeota bacterium]
MSSLAARGVARGLGGRWPGAGRLALVVVLLAVANLAIQVVTGLDAPAKTDYLPFATGAQVLQADPSCLYCMDAQASAQAAILGYRPTAGFPQPFVNPPLTALLLRPFAALPLRTGMAVFVLVLLFALLMAMRLASRLLPAAWPDWRRLLVMASAAFSIPAATALFLAQWAPLLLLAAVGALAAMRARRPVLAGLMLAALVVKPQTVWLALPLLAVAGSWRVLLGFGAGAAGWALTGLALVGPAELLQWPRLVLERHVGEAHRTAGLPGAVAGWTGSDPAAFVAAVVLAVAVVAGAVALRRRLRGRPEVALAVGVALSMVCAPHVFPDDLMLLAVTAIVWAPFAPRAAVASMIAVSAAYLVDGWLPAWAGHVTPLATLAVAVGAMLSLGVLRLPASWGTAVAARAWAVGRLGSSHAAAGGGGVSPWH